MLAGCTLFFKDDLALEVPHKLLKSLYTQYLGGGGRSSCLCIKACDIHLLLSSRPKCVDDVAYQEEVVAVLKKSLKDLEVSYHKKSIPIFYTPLI